MQRTKIQIKQSIITTYKVVFSDDFSAYYAFKPDKICCTSCSVAVSFSLQKVINSAARFTFSASKSTLTSPVSIAAMSSGNSV